MRSASSWSLALLGEEVDQHALEHRARAGLVDLAAEREHVVLLILAASTCFGLALRGEDVGDLGERQHASERAGSPERSRGGRAPQDPELRLGGGRALPLQEGHDLVARDVARGTPPSFSQRGALVAGGRGAPRRCRRALAQRPRSGSSAGCARFRVIGADERGSGLAPGGGGGLRPLGLGPPGGRAMLNRGDPARMIVAQRASWWGSSSSRREPSCLRRMPPRA